VRVQFFADVPLGRMKTPVNHPWLTRGVLVTLPALLPMLPENPKGLDGSINRMHTNRRPAFQFGRIGFFERWIHNPRPLPAAVGDPCRSALARYSDFVAS
jgi:hypothetical protein